MIVSESGGLPCEDLSVSPSMDRHCPLKQELLVRRAMLLLSQSLTMGLHEA